MKHVIALDVSKGKSTVAIYDGHRQCEFEGVLLHTRGDFERLHERIVEMSKQDGQAPAIVFEATRHLFKTYRSIFQRLRLCILPHEST